MSKMELDASDPYKKNKLLWLAETCNGWTATALCLWHPYCQQPGNSCKSRQSEEQSLQMTVGAGSNTFGDSGLLPAPRHSTFLTPDWPYRPSVNLFPSEL